MGKEYQVSFTNYQSAIRPPLHEEVGHAVERVATAVSNAWGFLKRSVCWVWEKAPAIIKSPVVERVATKFVEKVEGAGNALKSAASFAFISITKLLPGTAMAVQEFVKKIYRGACQVFMRLSTIFARVCEKLKGCTEFVWKHAPQKLKTLLCAFATRVNAMVTSLWAHLPMIFTPIANGVVNSLCFLWTALGLSRLWAMATAAASFLCPTWLWLQVIYVWRAKADIDRFEQWGNTEAFEGHTFNFGLLDLGQHQSGISELMMRRRHALQQVAQTGLFGWFFNPSVRLGLDTGLRQADQARQDRAHQEYLRDHQETQESWLFYFGLIGLVVGAAFLVASVFTHGIFSSLIFFLELLELVLGAAQLMIQRQLQQTRNDFTLTDEERQQRNRACNGGFYLLL